MSDIPPSGKGGTFHDVYFTTSAKRWYLTNDNHGITLDDERLSWTHQGTPDGARLANVAAVRLQSGGEARNPVHMCAITFADGFVLTATDADDRGFRSDEKAAPYRDFVQDLHRRLIAGGRDMIPFSAGLPPTNHTVVTAAAFLLGLLFFVLPIVLLMITGRPEILFTLLAGLTFLWPLLKLAHRNAPRAYDPRDLPSDLLP
ncbi:hypothetical protein [Muricoccus radiodurans]|uniref:hypothetical protein n=1 Tax=Muricoccus radiodurans TaxID=2231721 RepID=UPI003CF7E07F